MKILSIVGARPNFVKLAAVAASFKKRKSIRHVIVHKGQHQDIQMSESFFQDLDIPKPHRNLGIQSSLHGEATGKMLVLLEQVILEEKPDVVLVYGDVNSTLAGALAAAKLHVPLAHVEAGLRSYDREMPEEINRILTDHLSDLLFTTCREANEALIKEGIPKSKIAFVGNVMIDTLKRYVAKAKKHKILHRLGLKKEGYALVTLHRPVNVDRKETLGKLMSLLEKIALEIPVVFLVHPRTRKRIEKFGIKTSSRLMLLPPAGYLDFIQLMRNAKLVLTDSGGVQEETTWLSVPCLTLRENTEREVTIHEGTNEVVGTKPERVLRAVKKILAGKKEGGKRSQFWDGRAADRLTARLMKAFGKKRS